MSKYYNSKIDDFLNKESSDSRSESDINNDERKREIIQCLQDAADKLDRSPTIREYRSLDPEVSATTIRRTFGTWNKAKNEAGLETRERGKSTVVPINEDYFRSIDTSEKAYWLGTLFANSHLREQEKSDNCSLGVSRVENREYFVREFATAVDSEYPIRTISKEASPKSQQDSVYTQISNPTFVDNLLSAGYPALDENANGFPAIGQDFCPSFVRGYLESAGYFTTGQWEITAESMERANTFQEWFEGFGAKRPTISKNGPGAAQVRVANVFDIRSIFEACWPDQLETEPSWKPYPEKILRYLESEYPYPENVSYLPD